MRIRSVVLFLSIAFLAPPHSCRAQMNSPAENPARFNYYNNAGVGFYWPLKSLEEFPRQLVSIPVPIPVPTPVGMPVTTPAQPGEYDWHSLGGRQNYWRSQSGYYYPWCPHICEQDSKATSTRDVALEENPIYRFTSGRMTAAEPPVEQVITDLREYLLAQLVNKHIAQENYGYFVLVVDDLEAALKLHANASESVIRRRLRQLVIELSAQSTY